MLVVPSREALVFKARNPEQVLACIPTAKRMQYKGQELIVAPHRLDEALVLRNLGANVPSPINHYYPFPGKAPFDHQRKTCEFLTFHRRCAVLNQQRTGKTLSCIWAADYFMRLGLVRKVLIVAPLSTLDYTWAQALFESVPNRKWAILHGTRAKRLKLLKEDVRFFIVNHDGFNIVAKDLPEDIDLVIYDEAAVLRNPSTNRHRAFASFLGSRPEVRLWLLTGTPTPNEPTDAWALCRLIGAKVPRYTSFREMVMMKVGAWTWVPRPEANEIVTNFFQPSILFRRDDCFDQPEMLLETRRCELTAAQVKAYRAMLRTLAAEFEGQQITAVNEAVKVQKLLQCALGVMYDDNGNEAYIGCEPRIEVIREVIEECDEKVLVFVPFTGALLAIAAALEKHFGKGAIEVVHGGVSANARTDIYRRFASDARLRVIVAEARTMSHGLDLSSASTIIWAGPTNSNETYEQACARILGPKQTHKTSIVHIEATEVEKRAFERLRSKQKMQGLLLDLIQQQAV